LFSAWKNWFFNYRFSISISIPIWKNWIKELDENAKQVIATLRDMAPRLSIDLQDSKKY
jgi:hypothetical protein